MKKVLTIFLFICYAITSTGAAFYVHYCGGEIAAVSFKPTSDNEGCPECGMTQKKEGCCKDEKVLIKTSEKHKPSLSDLSPDTFVTLAPRYIYATNTTISNVAYPHYHYKHYPPDAPPPYILFCTLLI